MSKFLIIIFFLICSAGQYSFGQQPKLILPIGNTETISSVSFSSSGKYIVSSSHLDNIVIVWEANSGRIIFDHRELISTIQQSMLTDDEQYIVLFLNDGNIKWLDIRDGSTAFTANSDVIKFGHPLSVLQTKENKYMAILTDKAVYYKKFEPLKENESFKELNIARKGNYFQAADIKVIDKDILSLKYLHGETVELNLEEGSVLTKNMDTGNLYLKVSNTSIRIEDNKIRITSADGQKTIADLSVNNEIFIPPYTVSLSGKYLAAITEKRTVAVWQTTDWKQVFVLNNSFKATPVFVNNETRLLFKSKNHFELYDIIKNALVADLETDPIKMGEEIVEYSRDRRYLAWAKDLLIMVFDLQQGKLLSYLKGGSDKLNKIAVNKSEDLLLSASWDRYPKIWDLKKGSITQFLRTNTHTTSIGEANHATFSADASQVLSMDTMATFGFSSVARLWNVKEGHPEQGNFNQFAYTGAVFSTDNKTIIAWTNDQISFIENSTTNKVKQTLDLRRPILNIIPSPDNTVIAVLLNDGSVKLWSIHRQQFISSSVENAKDLLLLKFSTDSKLFATGSRKGDIKIYKTVDGTGLEELIGHRQRITGLEFSPDGLLLISASVDETLKVWETGTGQLKKTIDGHKGYFRFSSAFVFATTKFTTDGNYFFTSSGGGMTKKWETKTLTEIKTITNAGYLQYLSADNTYFITIDNAIIRLFSTATMDMMIAFLPIDSTDYLVVDKYSHYDGTEAARKKLYFTCGTEIIELAQAKDQLWVPNLAERVMKGETINAPALSDLNLCGLTPVVQNETNSKEIYVFTIKPGTGGLGETIVYVNGIETKRYKPGQLEKTKEGYELSIPKKELQHLFVAGKENPVTIKSLTADNTISSRGIVLTVDETEEHSQTPNLYAVMIGVSDYKGEELDLDYAAKDATDLSSAIANAARKFLNTDEKEHVFMYNLTTEKERYQLPEKKSIKDVLSVIGTKATASDILMIFFAGHGVMENKTKNFYFLTSDASPGAAVTALKNVGISMDTLMNWLNPNKIKAQKRLLIFDACNSGQAINDIVKSKNLVARDDSKAQLIKAIDKLNEESGLFILAGSASSQSAYEMGTYGQGLLTYSLLKAIKQQPSILEKNMFLNVSKWLVEAKNSAGELAKDHGVNQQPQMVSNNNFNIGLVDNEVMEKIVLLEEKPMFGAGVFINSDIAVADDDLGLSKLVNQQMNNLADKGTKSNIVYVNSVAVTNAYTIIGLYTVTGNTIKVVVNLKYNKEVKSKFEWTGTKDKLDELATAIVEKVTNDIK